MATLLFTPQTSIDANLMQHRLTHSCYYANWNPWTGSFEFEEDSGLCDQLEEELSQAITFDINGYFEIEN